MEQRIDLQATIPGGYRAVLELEQHVRSTVDERLLELVKLRASYLNECSFCIDMHATGAQAGGVDSRLLFAVAAWRESPWFDETERATLALTDAVTRLDGGVDDETWNNAVKALGEAQAAEVVLAIATINVWNRLAVTSRMAPPALAG